MPDEELDHLMRENDLDQYLEIEEGCSVYFNAEKAAESIPNDILIAHAQADPKLKDAEYKAFLRCLPEFLRIVKQKLGNDYVAKLERLEDEHLFAVFKRLNERSDEGSLWELDEDTRDDPSENFSLNAYNVAAELEGLEDEFVSASKPEDPRQMKFPLESLSLKAAVLLKALLEGFAEKRDLFVRLGSDPEEVDRAIEEFKHLKSRQKLLPEEADIDRYETLEQLMQTVQAAKQRAEQRLRTVKVKKLKLEEPDLTGLKVVKNDAKVLVAIPRSWEEAKVLGMGTRWCVSMLKDSSYWGSYSDATIYMAWLKNKPAPWMEDHKYLGPEERPVTKHEAWKVGVEYGVGKTKGGPGRYVVVPDLRFKVALVVRTKACEGRDAADVEIPTRDFLDETGMTFNDFGDRAWLVAQHAKVSLQDFVLGATPEIWDGLGQRTPLKLMWIEAKKKEPEYADKDMEAAWIEFWRALREEACNPSKEALELPSEDNRSQAYFMSTLSDYMVVEGLAKQPRGLAGDLVRALLDSQD
jgi:hypothetical protein